MAMIIAGANSYNTVAEFQTYLTDRGLSVTADVSILLIKAMDYIENRSYRGLKYDYTQGLQFPRSYLRYDDTSGEVPDNIIKAQLVAAYLADTEDLNPVVDRAIKREKVGPIEQEYMDNASTQKRFTELNDLLAPYLESSGTGLNPHR